MNNNKTIVLAALLAVGLVIPAYAQTESSDECYNSGVEDGKDNPFSRDSYDDCGGFQGEGGNQYLKGFMDGCLSVEGNTQEVCERAQD